MHQSIVPIGSETQGIGIVNLVPSLPVSNVMLIVTTLFVTHTNWLNIKHLITSMYPYAKIYARLRCRREKIKWTN